MAFTSLLGICLLVMHWTEIRCANHYQTYAMSVGCDEQRWDGVGFCFLFIILHSNVITFFILVQVILALCLFLAHYISITI